MRLLVVLLLLLTPAVAAAQDASADARVTQEVVEVGGSFRYQVDASVRGAADIELSKAPGFGKLQVVGQQTMPQLITINGVTERRLSVRYALVAAVEGEVTIEPPTFRVGRSTVKANAVKVTVVKKGAAPKQPTTPARDSRFFIETTLTPSDRPPYVGEQLTLRYDLFVDGAQMDVQPANSREPALDDFWIQELTDRVARLDQMVSVSGRLYKRTSMWTYALFPLRAGPVEIEPAEVELIVGGFFRRGQAAQIASQSLNIDVQPLPPNAPAGFHEGNVGNWAFKVSTDESQTRVGRPIVVELSATGEGQVSRVKLPELPAIPHTRRGDVDVSSSPQIRSTTVGGVHSAKYTITPLKEGKLTIPALEFSWFDPTRGKYRTTKSAPVVVTVAAGEAGAAPIGPAEVARRTAAADEDIVASLTSELRPVRENPATEHAPDPARFPWVYWVAIAAAILFFLVTAFAERVRAYLRRAAPQHDARARARAAVAAFDAEPADAGELARMIRDGLNSAYDVPRGAVTAAELPRAFAQRGLDQDAAADLAAVLRKCEDARFAPDGSRLDPKLVQRARQALEKLAAALLVLVMLHPMAHATEAGRAEIAANPHSVDVLFNVGTEAAQRGDYGVARLALERAAYLDPWDSDVEHNRSLVERIVRLNAIERSRTGRTMEGDETLFWWGVASHINAHLLGLSIVAFWLLAAAAIRVRRRTDSPAVRDAAAVALIVALLLAVSATAGAVARTRVLDTARPVVVLTAELELREGPNSAAKLKRTPPTIMPGTLLRVVDEREGWVKVSWQSDAGWTRTGALERVDF